MKKTAKFRIGQCVKVASRKDNSVHKVRNKRQNSKDYWHYTIAGVPGDWKESDLRKAKR